MKKSEMISILDKRRKEYVSCCKKVDYGKLLEILEECGMKPPKTVKDYAQCDRSHIVELYGHCVVPSGYIEVYEWESEDEG